jgi:F0F1-type ATP synthase delta subunit
MKQPRTKISKVIADKTLKGGISEQLAKEVAAYLLSANRTRELNSILRDVQVTWAEAGHVEVTAFSAHPLSAEIRDEIKRQVGKLYPTAKQIQVIEEHDSSVIGGVRLELPNQQLDLSVAAKLSKLKQLTMSGKD